ncbi:conserved hypothetical protein [Culex quinquefasciatus]|uniref:MADS-box domain-containing protein n=1 Tax=Culex quinquefasciatus TaxID=7176 RepID=B0XBM7_CULQU|nr:conserved hypothetical protein [Culex quinquefasciatus]|eukprot:XP_001867049.1 conserved hypothetical protein [Culex quinquefasciatus]
MKSTIKIPGPSTNTCAIARPKIAEVRASDRARSRPELAGSAEQRWRTSEPQQVSSVCRTSALNNSKCAELRLQRSVGINELADQHLEVVNDLLFRNVSAVLTGLTRAVPVDNPRAVNLPLVPVPRKAAKIWEIMDPNAARDSRYNLNYSMSMMSETPEIYGNPNVSLARPPSGGLVGQVMSRGGQLMSANGPQCGSGAGGGGGGGGGGLSGGRGIKRANSDCYDDGRQLVGSQSGGMTGLEGCQVGGSDVVDESYTSLQPKKSPPSNGKKTKGRVKIKMEYIDNKLRRYTTFSKRKTGIMKKPILVQ